MKLLRKTDTDLPAIRLLMRSIALSGVLLTLAVVGINAWMLRESWNNTVSRAEAMAVNLSLSQARQAEDTLLQTELSLREVQRTLQAQMASGVNGAALSQIMRDLQGRLPQLHGLFYYDAQGKWIATSERHVPTNINNSDREYFSYHRANLRNSLHIGPVIRSRSTGDLVIPVSVRVNDSAGGFNGVLLATIKVDYFRRFYSYYELGNRDVLVLMLADSTVLYARPLPDSVIGKSMSGSRLFQEMLARTDSGSGEWNSALDGADRIFGFARSERYPLVVAAGYDENSLFRSWVAGKVQDVTLNIALLGAIIMLGVLILRQARRSLRYQLELSRLRDELTAVNLSLETLANADGLTGLANRRQFDRFLQSSLAQAQATGTTVSLILMDIDYFKRYNDTYGHVAGDECLKTVARALKNLPLRATDIVARYGGEEFAIIMPGSPPAAALSIADHAVKAIRQLAIPHHTSAIAAGHVTLSAGCASSGKVAAEILIHKADEALYRAKQQGRDRMAAEESSVSG